MKALACAIILALCVGTDGYRVLSRKLLAERNSTMSKQEGMSEISNDQTESTRSTGPFDGDPFVWLENKFKGMLTTIRTVQDDDDAPMDQIKSAAAKIVDSMGGDINAYTQAIRRCSWLQAVPESAAKPIQQPIPDNLDLGVLFKARSKPGYIGRYDIVVASVAEGSVAQSLGIVPGMHPSTVRGIPTAFKSSNLAHHGDMTEKQFNVALKGPGEAIVWWDPPDYQQRRVAAVRKCMLDISSVCRSDAVRPLEVTAVQINSEEHCSGCYSICAERPQSKYETSEVTKWSSLLVPGQNVDVRVPLEVKNIEISDGSPEGMELSGNVIQVDSAKSREHCLFTGMTLVEVNGQRMDVEQPLDHLDGAWRYSSSGSEKEYFVQRRRNDESGEYEYHFLEKFKSSKDKTGLLVDTEMENGHWWLADLGNGQQIRLRRDGMNMVSQFRSSPKGKFSQQKQASLASPRQRLEADRGIKLSLKVRPIGVKEIQVMVKSVRTTSSSFCGAGQAEVQVSVDDADADDAWRRAFKRHGAVPISFPALDMRKDFQCEAFIADSFDEVVDAAKDVASDDLKWGTLQVSLSVTAGVTAVIFPPVLGLHGVGAIGATIGIKSVGTALQAGAHGAERVSHGEDFNGSAVALELGVGIGLNAVSAAGGHGIGHLVGHHLVHGSAASAGKLVGGQMGEVAIEEVGDLAVEKALHKITPNVANDGTSETISEHCMEILF